MNWILNRSWKIGVLFATLAACNEQTDIVSVPYAYDYTPLYLGKYITYAVDSVVYDFSADRQVFFADTTRFEWQEIVTDTFTDGGGRLNYLITQRRRDAPTQAWQTVGTTTALLTATSYEVVANNRRFVKVIFPLFATTQWDGNRHFDPTEKVIIAGESLEMFKGWWYQVAELDAPAQVGNFQFDQTLALTLVDEENLIERRYAAERYAKGVGLVSLEYRMLDTQCIEACAGKTWEEKAERGFILRMTAIDYSN